MSIYVAVRHRMDTFMSKYTRRRNFKECPDMFFQFYVLFGERSNFIVPCCYIVLPNKTTKTYIETLAVIKNIVKPIEDNVLQTMSPANLPIIEYIPEWLNTMNEEEIDINSLSIDQRNEEIRLEIKTFFN